MIQSIKIIAINGSPNKDGNTATLMKWVIEGVKEQDANVELIQISDLNINYCQGCNNCLKTGECVIQDDLPEILKKLTNADGYIIGSPVYGGKVTAQLKTLMDRITLLKLYGGILSDGFSVGVATSGIAPTKSVAKDAASLFGHRIGEIGVKCASINGGFKPLKANSDQKKKKIARELGIELVERCKSGDIGWSLKKGWINFLRKTFLKKMIQKNENFFKGVIKIWKEKSWL
ncbi:MAG: flavodoxin family protein [Promethearchaeota archaeon]|nr:MAG: flavodoxin family protein [Candidatus Lokiarchaeota archaeon]